MPNSIKTLPQQIQPLSGQTPPVYALVDANNFFVSCEKLFRPDLANKPVVVLSSNDGCVISRSNEAKSLGIPMGAPVFKYRDLFQRYDINVFSANFELYGDISERIMALLTSITPHIEQYSIDEAFLGLSDLHIDNTSHWGRAVREQILRHIGVPVSIGIAGTKTLCKAASHWAKKYALTGGSVSIEVPSSFWSHLLRNSPVEDVWGVGLRLAPRLRAEQVFTALDLANLRPRRAQQLMGIHGRHMVYELNGTSCLPLQNHTKSQQVISRGRQFGRDTNDQAVVEAAITSLAARAARELRKEHQLATKAAVALQTNRFKPGYTRTLNAVDFYTPTADTGIICKQLTSALLDIFRGKLMYHGAEVLLYNLTPDRVVQTDIFGSVDLTQHTRSQARMHAVDDINIKYGPCAVRPAAELLSESWQGRSNMLSPRYTSSWEELPIVHQKLATNL